MSGRIKYSKQVLGYFARFARQPDGSVAVEFALVSPILILLLLGILAYGVLFGIMHSVQELASEAARASIAGLSNAEREQLAREQVTAALPGYSLLRADRLETDFVVDAADPRLYHVVLRYDPSYLGFEAFAGIVEIGTDPFRRQATVRRGGY